MNKFLQHLLGTMDVPYFFALVFFAMTGAVISLLIHASNRNKESMNTPYRFNFWFLIRDNWQRVILNLILIVVTIRFCTEITGYKITEFVALLIGVFYDKLGEFLRNKNILDKKQQP